MRWFQDSGGIANGVTLGVGTFGLGVISTTGTEEEEGGVLEDQEVLVVPLDIVICRRTASKLLGTVFDGIKDDGDLVALFLMRERALGARSRWAPYIKLLPQFVPLPTFFR